ncbi:IS66 family transposase, partial [Acidomonas methanolica]|uniref:IS66 family transposase n=1 Tax=Acidomonas methanolica TaxID=437 RepID=UPI0022329AE6
WPIALPSTRVKIMHHQTPGLNNILVSKFDDHLPLYRQAEILARQGVEIPRSTLIDWCGQAVAVLRPLVTLIRQEVTASD